MKKILMVGILFLMLAGIAFSGGQQGAGTGPRDTSYLNETGYPIVRSPISPTLMINFNHNRGVEPSRNPVWQRVEEITGIRWEYIVVYTTTWNERVSLIWASNDLPDMFYNGIGRNELFNYSRVGMILDLAPYVDRYAPAFRAIMDRNDDVRRAVTLPDGKIASFFQGQMDTLQGIGQCPPEYPLVDIEWLDRLGLRMPESMDEFVQVARAFRDRDPNGNGIQDEIPIAFQTWSGVSQHLKIMMPWFGIMADARETFLDGNTIRFVPFMSEYVDFVKFCRMLYAERLIDPDIFILNASQIVAKGTGGNHKVYGMAFTSGASVLVGETRGLDLKMMYPILRAPNGREMWWNRVYANPGVGVISASSRYAEALIRWCDMFYTPEYNMIAWMGFEGQAHVWDPDGSWRWNLRSPSDTGTALRGELTMQHGANGPNVCPPEWMLMNDPGEGPINAERNIIAASGRLRVAVPQLYFEPADMRTINTIAADISSYENQMFARFVTGELDIDREYQAFVSQLRQMGADNMVSLLQRAYDASR